LVLAEVVRVEVADNLLFHAERWSREEASHRIEQFQRLVDLARPELVPRPEEALVLASRHLIRHASDVPVLLSAMACNPDWLLTHNTRHFTQALARRTGLRIATPSQFFRTLSSLLR